MDLAYMASMPAEEFIQRRQQLIAQLADNSATLIFSAKQQVRSNDSCYPFRQDSYFWYLTGFNEPDSVLLLIKRQGQVQQILFLRPSDPLMETWNGRRLGIEKATQTLSLDQAFAIEQFSEKFIELTQGLELLYHKAEQQKWGDLLLVQIGKDFKQQSWANILDEMRLIKSNNEIALMQQAGQITALGHIRAMKQTRPNRFEYEIEGEIRYEFSRFGCRSVAYNSIVAGGENACILHYNENDQLLRDGDLLLIDAGCEFAMYAGDITRTFPINGKFSQPQKEIYQLVLDAQKAAIDILVVGNSIQQANDEVARIMVEGLVKLGILKGDPQALLEQQAHRQFYMHGLGHWLGLDVHDVGSYSKNSHNNDRNSKLRDRPLEVGMVMTVEPGLYIAPNNDVPEQYKGIGVRIEDNILITEYGNKILTSAVPKEIDDIEQLMSQG